MKRSVCLQRDQVGPVPSPVWRGLEQQKGGGGLERGGPAFEGWDACVTPSAGIETLLQRPRKSPQSNYKGRQEWETSEKRQKKAAVTTPPPPPLSTWTLTSERRKPV